MKYDVVLSNGNSTVWDDKSETKDQLDARLANVGLKVVRTNKRGEQASKPAEVPPEKEGA